MTEMHRHKCHIPLHVTHCDRTMQPSQTSHMPIGCDGVTLVNVRPQSGIATRLVWHFTGLIVVPPNLGRLIAAQHHPHLKPSTTKRFQMIEHSYATAAIIAMGMRSGARQLLAASLALSAKLGRHSSRRKVCIQTSAARPDAG